MFEMKIKKILLVGCGNIGSRHLQSLIKSDYKLSIDVIEPNKNSQKIARKLIMQISGKEKQEIFWHSELSDINSSHDLVIVATKSKGRVDLIEKILFLGNKRFLIEKIVAQSALEYNKLIKILKKFQAKCWVNTNRRYFKHYKKIQKEFKILKPVNVSVFAGNSDLGTSAIHYLDLFSWINSDFKIKINGIFLDKKIYKNKRGKDYKKFLGTLIATNKKKSIATLTFHHSEEDSFIVHIFNGSTLVTINELKEVMFIEKNGNQRKVKFMFRHVSDLTKFIVNDIFTKDSCLLPTVEELYFIHLELFRVFNSHLKKINNKQLKVCPIT